MQKSSKGAIEAKQFGRLTGGQIEFAVETRRRYAKLLEQALPDLLRSKMAANVEAEFGPITWAWVYDLPYVAALALMVITLGLDEDLREAVKQENPTAAALESVRRELESEEIEVPEGAAMDALRIALLVAWHFNDRAILDYSLSMNSLIAKGQAGDDQGFISAISIDPTAASSKAFTYRLGHAKIFGQHGFLKRYRAALKGPHVARRGYRLLRWTDFLLRDIEAGSTATAAEIYDLVSGVLNQYSDRGKDPVKGLQSRRDEWKKEATS